MFPCRLSKVKVRIAIHLEENLKEFHMSTVVAFANPEMGKLFTEMMNNDQGHVTMLQDALKKTATC